MCNSIKTTNEHKTICFTFFCGLDLLFKLFLLLGGLLGVSGVHQGLGGPRRGLRLLHGGLAFGLQGRVGRDQRHQTFDHPEKETRENCEETRIKFWFWLKLKLKLGNNTMTFYVFEIWHKFNFKFVSRQNKNKISSKFSSESDIDWPWTKAYLLSNCYYKLSFNFLSLKLRELFKNLKTEIQGNANPIT